MNPSITLATILTGHTPAARGLIYVVAQVCARESVACYLHGVAYHGHRCASGWLT